MRSATLSIQVLLTYIGVLLSAQLVTNTQTQISNDVDTEGEWSLDWIKSSAAETNETLVNAPPYNLTQQQMEDFETIMSAGEDLPSKTKPLANHTNDTAADYMPELTRSFFCLPIMRLFNVNVRRDLLPDERIAVVGDHERLGAWQVERGIEMTRSKWSAQSWSAKVAICASGRLYYRYFIYSVDKNERRRVLEWEGVPYGRVLERYQMYSPPGKDQFGLLSHTTIGDVEQEKGWLRHEYAIEFKFIWRKHMKFYRYLNLQRASRFLLKMSLASGGFALPMSAWRGTALEVSHYAYNRSHFQPQPKRGVRYVAGEIVIFRFSVPLGTQNSYLLSISTIDGNRVGEVLILPVDLRGTDGVLRLPIQGTVNGFQLGALILPYLIVRPLVGAADYNLRGSFQRYWPMNWPSLDVGRRGIGASFKARAPFIENTIASFMYAYKHKADMVELNVQLTRDYVPVIWHDFGFLTTSPGRDVWSVADLEYVRIKDLTYMQLKSSRVFVIEDDDIYEYSNFNVRHASLEERIFPLLLEIFENLPPTLGLDIEIKWPQTLESGVMESLQTLNKNRVVDVILKTTIQHGCGRPLIFSSFDADICTMLRLKQNVFAVAFITLGEISLSLTYKDLRARSYLDAVNFAQSANLLGTIAHADEFLDDSALLDFGLDLGQATFVWSDDFYDAQMIKRFKRWHVSGVIYDRLDLYGRLRKRENLFNAPELLDLFMRQCIVVGHWNCTNVLATPDGFDLHGKPVSRLGCEVVVHELN